MKKMWKLNNKAVSPVIATILMVAITVVLAAVLYVMVMGFGGETNTAPTASLTASEDRLVIQISSPVDITTTMSLKVGIGTAAGVVFPAVTNAAPTEIGTTGIMFVDAGADGKVNTGDYFVLETGTTAADISLMWTSGGSTTIIAEGEL